MRFSELICGTYFCRRERKSEILKKTEAVKAAVICGWLIAVMLARDYVKGCKIKNSIAYMI